jgi:DNA-binding CsgD family transcriptional regulator
MKQKIIMVTEKNNNKIAQFHDQSAQTDNVHLKYVHKLDIRAIARLVAEWVQH